MFWMKWLGKLARRTIAVGIITLVPSVLMAQVSVTVGGTTYEIDAFTGTYNEDQALLESQPWYGNAALAGSISETYYSAEGRVLSNDGDPIKFATSKSTFVNVVYGLDSKNSIANIVGPSTPTTFAIVSSGAGGASSVPEINGGVLFQAFLILFSAWLVMRNASFRLRKFSRTSTCQAPV